MISQLINDLSPQDKNPQQIAKTIINDQNLNKLLALIQPIIKPIIKNCKSNNWQLATTI